MKLHLSMGVLLWICCMFSGHLFLGTPLSGCSCIFQQSADLNFKNFPFGGYHAPTSQSHWTKQTVKNWIFGEKRKWLDKSQKVCYVWAKKGGVMCDTIEEWRKIWRRTDLCFEKWHNNWGEFLPNTRKSQNLQFSGLFLIKVFNVSAKKL